MRVSRVYVQRFRGIAAVDWSPGVQALCCLIGPGDSAKTTMLDAVEAALSPRWITFTEADFHQADTQQEFSIEVTVTELSRALLSDERFGLFLRGLGPDGNLHDEPEDDDEPALTVRLSVDATMEPVWSLVCDRYPLPRILSNRDRALFGLVRLAGEEARHLTWAQGSVLSKMTDATDDAAQRLADAYRQARQSANLGSIEALADASTEAERRARALGAYVSTGYAPDLELGRGGFNSGAIALHDGAVPLRLAGLGTRRLATLAIQRSSIDEGAIVLVDELEQGLEPHRILGAMAQMRKWQVEAAAAGRAQGQILMTTHSDVVLSELPAEALYVMRMDAMGGADIRHATEGGDVARILQHSPRAFFGRKILLCEGATELGLMLGLREHFPGRHGDIPIEHRGVAIIDGHGSAAPPLAAALGALGYPVALFRDSDRALNARSQKSLDDAGVWVIEYGELLNTEQALFTAADDAQIDQLFAIVQQALDPATHHAQLREALPLVDDVTASFAKWDDLGILDTLKMDVGNLAVAMKWLKSEAKGRAISSVVNEIVQTHPATRLARCLMAVERWLYE